MTTLWHNEKITPAELSNIECKSADTKPSMSATSTNEHVEKRFDNIVKSPNDNRLYRGLVLTNKMKVLLISDSTTDKSAAALDVDIGFMSDPDDIPGLAHFCEHMLFLGTEKYPQENEYNMYLSQNGGRSNAATHKDHTNYYFNVVPEKLEGALDRFAQFFLTPLFTESLTELELNAVHSEHEKNLSEDTWRFDQLERSSAIPNHPYSKFGSGNRLTLDTIPKQNGINVRDKLLEFHQKYYSANLMALCVLGKESLDSLETMVVERFSQVENKEIEAPVWDEHPFNSDHFEHKWYIVPIKDIRQMHIRFPIPDLRKHYRSSPGHYLCHLLGHEGKGSLLSAFKARGWANSIIAGRQVHFFTVAVDLTEEGIQHIDDILTLMFQYINMIKEEGPVKWIYEEDRDIAEIGFRFRDKISPLLYVSSLGQRLHKYPFEDVLTAEHLVPEWRPDLITWVLGNLTPEKIRVQIVGKVFEEMCTETEKWYGTKFKKEKIPEEVTNHWKNCGLSPDLRLPDKNEFIPTRFDIKPRDENAEKFPVIIQDTPFIRMWFKQDDEFLVPKANLTFEFVSPLAYLDPISYNLTYMFASLLKDSLNEYTYAADLAGLKWELGHNKFNIMLIIGEYDDKQRVLLDKILDRMVNFKPDPKRFEVLKENYVRALKNIESEQPYQHAVYYLAVLLSEQVWLRNEFLQATSHITLERLEAFVPQFLSKIHVESFVHGNVTAPEAIELAKLVETKLTNASNNMIPLLPRQLVPYREIKLDDNCHFLYEIEKDVHKSSCSKVFYQTGLQSTESNMLLELLAQIISEPCFTTLRTKEQLGYIVFSGVRRTSGTQGLIIAVQSDRHPQYVEQRIDSFVDAMVDHITEMSDEEWERHKESLAKNRLEKPKTLSALSAVFWNEILTQQYNFDRVNIEVEYLRTITREQLLDFFKKTVYSEERRKLSVHVISTAEGGAGTVEQEATSEEECEKPSWKKIDDIVAFKISQSLFPLMKPFNNVPRKGARPSKL